MHNWAITLTPYALFSLGLPHNTEMLDDDDDDEEDAEYKLEEEEEEQEVEALEEMQWKEEGS
jgi:hypothetical protein